MKTIQYKGHIPIKRFGQNFLIDQSVICNIVNVIKPKFNDILIEIGPGLGELTIPLSYLLYELSVIEIDSNLSNRLKKIFFGKKILIINNNVLQFNFFNFFNKKKKPIRIIGNLPYNISTKLVVHLIYYKEIFIDMHFMFQKEVAERLIATKNSTLYGRLSIIAQSFYNIKKLIDVSYKSFFPNPKINSCFIRLIPKKEINYSIKKTLILSKITKLAFQQRRKILHNSLSTLFNKNDFIKLNINSNYRAQNLSVLQYHKLVDYFIRYKCIKSI